MCRVEEDSVVTLRWLIVDPPPPPSVEELAADRRRSANARAHCPGCGGFCRREKVTVVSRGGLGSRRVAEGWCGRCGEYEIPLD